MGRRSALYHLISEEKSSSSNPISYPTHFICEVNKKKKKKFNSSSIEKCFSQVIGSIPEGMRSNSYSEFIKEILITKAKLNIPECQQIVEVKISPSYNITQSEVMSYIQEYNTTDFTEHRKQLEKAFNLLDVEKNNLDQKQILKIYSSFENLLRKRTT